MEESQGVSVLDHALQEGHVAVYDFRGRNLPDLICDKPSGSVSLFSREGKNHRFQSKEFPVQQYGSLFDVPYRYSDIHLLDGEAIKLLFVKFPGSAPYTLARIALRLSWIMGLLGLVRRLAVGQIKLKGIVTLKSRGGSQRWLAIEYLKFRSAGDSLSCDVGIQGFLDYLREERVQYVVCRFYQKLPELYRTGGDLDILVADEDIEKVVGFLSAHPGNITVDAWAVSHNYYHPPLATRILKNGVDGPAGSRVPAPKEAFLSFAYHALYHKGFYAGIPSRLPDANVNPKPDNDYAGILASMADDLNIQVPMDMESLDDYLHQEGWRPKLGFFPKYRSDDEWIYGRLLPHRHTAEVGLGLLVLKQGAIRLGLVDRILKEIEREQYTVIQSKIFDEDGKQIALTMLRGGNWIPSSLQSNILDEDGEQIALTRLRGGSWVPSAGGTPHDYVPAMAVVVLDTRPYSMFHAKRGAGRSRCIPMKRALGKKFVGDEDSFIHSTDHTHEAWEYIEVCFPEEVQSIRDKIDEYFQDFEASSAEKLRFSIQLSVRRNVGVQNLQRRGRTLIRRLMK